jgi:hypothetical protein
MAMPTNPRTRSVAIALGLALLVAAAAPAGAKVYHSRSEALALAFPDADSVEVDTRVLTESQAKRVEEIARSPLESQVVKLYTARKNGAVAGYGFIDMHTVRTMPEAFLVVLTATGEVRSLRMLAFHEPAEYRPTERWYGQFERKSLAQPLRVGRDIHAIVGATLSARATTRGVRRALALYEVLVQNRP